MKVTLTKIFSFVLALLLSTVNAKAERLPSACYAEAAQGTYYLYNVAQGKFLMRLSNNFPGLSLSPAEVTLTRSGAGFTIRFADGKYLKTGFWNNQYLWTDGVAGITEGVWAFDAIADAEKVYQLKRTSADTWNNQTGIFYANGTNAATTVTDDCMWALVDMDAYFAIAMEKTIPAKYRSEIPSDEGKYYLFDVLNQQFLNTTNCTLTDAPAASATITPSENRFLISGTTGKYLKIGVYKGQYLWSDGDAQNTKWTIAPTNDKETERVYHIYTDNFTETLAEVAGKTMYLIGTNTSAVKPSRARWALITEADYVDYLSSGEGAIDNEAVAVHKTVMTDAKGDATSLLQNPTFERSADGWWGGERSLNQLYRGNGYSYDLSADGSVMLQTIKHMPHGIYKVVAAVRGDYGTSVSARLADVEGDAVLNSGCNSTGSQLNINGVRMPYCSFGGFSKGENSQGWNWATSTATLDKDGHLKVEFVMTGNGTVSISDVHLYYMGDGENTYAMEYTDGVDATAHAITCDLSTANPNRLFTSTGTITTVSGAKLNNNLVGGMVSNLVIWDGYDFTVPTNFIANKATYYRHISAGTTDVLCVPFVINTGTDGNFYKPKSLGNNTLKLEEVTKPEAGKPYLYHSNNETMTFTGSGHVSATPASNLMSTGTFTHIAGIPQGCYLLKGNQLCRTTGTGILDAFRVYFRLDSNAPTISLNFNAIDDNEIWQKPQTTFSDFAIGQECYLYNVKAARFYTEGNSYGTQASVGETGLKVKFVQNGSAVKLTNYSQEKNSWRTAFVTTNGAVFVDGENVAECNWQVVPGTDKTFKLMIASPNPSYNQENYPGAMFGLDLFEYDLRTNLAALLFTDEEPGENLYLTDWAVVSIADYEAYQTAVATYKTALQLKKLLEEAVANGIDVTAETTVYENTANSQDELTEAIFSVTNKLIEKELSGASRENPFDLTDKFIMNARYENNDNEGWNGTAPSIDAVNNLQNAEFFNKNFDCYQDLVGLPEGYYRLSLQGFYRAGLEGPSLEAKMSGNEDAVMHAELYVTTDNKTTTTKMQSIFTGAPATALGVNGEIHNGDWWVPNTMSSAAAYFAAGNYSENNIEVQVTNGKLRIGLRKNTTIRRDWVMIDNWKLEYLGKNAE